MSDLKIEIADRVMVLTIDRPETKNSLGGSVMSDLLAAVEAAAHDDRIRAVVTIGSGDKYWCTGGDPDEVREAATARPAHQVFDPTSMGLNLESADSTVLDELGPGRWTLRLLALDKPWIAAVNGWTVGGGLGLCLLHDIRVASTRARFASGYIGLGLGPEHGLSATLPMAVGTGVASDLLFSGRTVDAEEALRIGLVTQLVAPEHLAEHAFMYAASIARFGRIASRSTKRTMGAMLRRAVRDQLVGEWNAQLRCFSGAARLHGSSEPGK